MFEWQKHSQKCTSIAHYQDLLEFLSLRAQATESILPDLSNQRLKHDSTQIGEISLVAARYFLVQPMQSLLSIDVLYVRQRSIPYMPAPDSETCLTTTRYPL